MLFRIAIQVISYNRPAYLEQTLASLHLNMDKNDKICVLEQSDDKKLQEESISICKRYPNIHLITIYKNLGQRAATNVVYNIGFFDNCEYIMLSDQDVFYNDKLDVYCDKLEKDPSIFVATGCHSPEHDIEKKSGEWLLKSTLRATHMVFRSNDFYKMMPIDINYDAGTKCSWFAGLDWNLTWWNNNSAGFNKRIEFVACYPGGATHIGRQSTWQGYYNDEIENYICIWMRSASLEDIIKKYPPKHIYVPHKYEYEKILLVQPQVKIVRMS